MATETQSLERLSKFENLFHKMNLLLGLRIWLRTTGIMMLVNLGAVLIGLIQAAPELAFLALAALNIYLFQRAASAEARVRYGMPVSPWCWWSINWRLIVYLLPVAIVLVIAGGPIDIEDDNRPTQKELERLGYAQLIIASLSIIPMGLATSQALLVSKRKLVAMGWKPLTSEDSPRSDPSAEDERDGEAGDNNSDSNS